MARHLGVVGVNIFSRDEAKKEGVRSRMDEPRLNFPLGDVRDRESVENAFVSRLCLPCGGAEAGPVVRVFPRTSCKDKLGWQSQRNRSSTQVRVRSFLAHRNHQWEEIRAR